MRRVLLLFLILVWVLGGPAFAAQPPQGADDAAIRTVIAAQAMAWNRGDVTAFMQGYEDSPDTAFVGAGKVRKGFQPILDRYKQTYSTRAQMGTLTFSNIAVRLLPGSCGAVDYAVVFLGLSFPRAVEMEISCDEGVLHRAAGAGQQPHGNIRESQRAHLRPGGVGLLVPVEDRLKSFAHGASANERGFGRVFVSLHERGDVAAVPRHGLSGNDGANRGLIRALRSLHCKC